MIHEKTFERFIWMFISLWGQSLKGTEGAGGSDHQDTFNNLPVVLVNQGGHS